MRPILGILLLVVPLACAERIGPPPAQMTFAPPRSEAEAEARVRFLEQRLEDGQLHAQAWQWGWTAINAGGLVSSVIPAARTGNSGQRVYNVIGSTQSAMGLADLWVFRPMPGRAGAAPMRDGDPSSRLARGEALLRERAVRAERRTSWLEHLGNFALQAISAGILLGLDEPRYAAITFGSGMVAGEANIWSAPWEPLNDLRDYRRLVDTGLPPAPSASLAVVPTAGGVALRLAY